jgi:hypothetical protein
MSHVIVPWINYSYNVVQLVNHQHSVLCRRCACSIDRALAAVFVLIGSCAPISGPLGTYSAPKHPGPSRRILAWLTK